MSVDLSKPEQNRIVSYRLTRRERIELACALGVFLALLAAVVLSVTHIYPAATTPAPTGMVSCPSEDANGVGGQPCYWDATTSGNGRGKSFVAMPDGTVHYLLTGPAGPGVALGDEIACTDGMVVETNEIEGGTEAHCA